MCRVQDSHLLFALSGVALNGLSCHQYLQGFLDCADLL